MMEWDGIIRMNDVAVNDGCGKLFISYLKFFNIGIE